MLLTPALWGLLHLHTGTYRPIPTGGFDPRRYERTKALEMRVLRRIEHLLLVIGLTLITMFIAGHIHRTILSRAELDRFRELQVEHVAVLPTDVVSRRPLEVDFSLWSDGRIAAYKQSLLEHLAPPLAVLHIPKLSLDVPLLTGTDELALNRGVGHIAGTAYPGETGNIGIAGHRDGFFRGLKDIQVGDLIELETINRKDSYRVERMVIVPPTDVSVLQPGRTPGLTLVTCYPFYLFGSAPRRYIVQALLTSSRAVDIRISQQAEFEPEMRGHEQGAGIMRFKPATQNVKPKVQTPNQEKIQ